MFFKAVLFLSFILILHLKLFDWENPPSFPIEVWYLLIVPTIGEDVPGLNFRANLV